MQGFQLAFITQQDCRPRDRLHATDFFELGDLSLKLTLATTAEQVERLNLLSIRTPIEFGRTGPA